jgi:hypothetical protein
MDILYYSNYCKHSKKLLLVLSRCKNLKEKISFVCIDKRTSGNKTSEVFIHLENGTKIIKPPNLHSVPALLLIKEQYRLLYGDEIIDKIKPYIISDTNSAENFNGEPMSYAINSAGNNLVSSERFTSYDLNPDELSAKGMGGRRNIGNYVSADIENISIFTPDDDYKADKIDNGVTIDSLQQERNNMLENKRPPPQMDF